MADEEQIGTPLNVYQFLANFQIVSVGGPPERYFNIIISVPFWI